MNHFFVGFRGLLPCTAKSIQVTRQYCQVLPGHSAILSKYCQVTRQYCRVTGQYARSRGFRYFAVLSHTENSNMGTLVPISTSYYQSLHFLPQRYKFIYLNRNPYPTISLKSMCKQTCLFLTVCIARLHTSVISLLGAMLMCLCKIVPWFSTAESPLQHT